MARAVRVCIYLNNRKKRVLYCSERMRDVIVKLVQERKGVLHLWNKGKHLYIQLQNLAFIETKDSVWVPPFTRVW